MLVASSAQSGMATFGNSVIAYYSKQAASNYVALAAIGIASAAIGGMALQSLSHNRERLRDPLVVQLDGWLLLKLHHT